MGYRQQVCFILFLFLTAATNGHTQKTTKPDTLRELLRRIDILTEEIEKAKLGEVAEPEYESRFGMGPAASRVYQLTKTGVSIAGYGEVVYENFSTQKDDGTESNKINQIDFLRHITYFGFRFNDWLLFNSEIEFEHAKTGKGAPGEVAIEFGYIEVMINSSINLRAGMVLVPVGIINEMHEPPTFHGSLRPEMERRIIPTTWRANGLGFVGTTKPGLDYKLYIIESLNAAKFSSNGIRSSRQNGAKAKAEDFAITGRINYTGISGLDVGGSFFTGNTGQSLRDTTGQEINARINLFSFHLMFARKGFEFRSLYAYSTIDDVLQLNSTLDLTGNNSIGNKQFGVYVTAAFDLMPILFKGTSHYLAPFVQYEKFNTQSKVPVGYVKNPAWERSNLTLGLTYKPHPNVAFKLDFINRADNANTALDQFNLALNYLF